MEDKAECHEGQTCEYRIYHHGLDIELQRLLRFRADADNADADKFGYLAAQDAVEHLEACEQVEDELCDAVVRRQ